MAHSQLIDLPATSAEAQAAVAELRAKLAPDVVSTEPLDLMARAHDASHFLLTPKAVVTARSAQDVAQAFAAARANGLPVTLRSGGTSLSGQAGGDGILIDVRQNFRRVDIVESGERVIAGPGATIRSVNARLHRFGRKLGPDPASEIACTVGGVVANNSSGMACGTEFNTYQTLESMVLVLPSGTVLDTGAPDANDQLRTKEPELFAGLIALRDRVRSNPYSVERIRHLFSMKNTMGYGINSFLDHNEPVKALEHLVIGSEGTLGFVAQATFRTVPVAPHIATGLFVFPRVTDATDALEALLASGAKTLELMDARSLQVVQPDVAADNPLSTLAIKDHTALLVELQEMSAEALAQAGEVMAKTVSTLPLDLPVEFTSDSRKRAELWHVRKGLYTTVAGARPVGTTPLLEDIVVPVGALSNTVESLGTIFTANGYDDAVVFGHAKDGNVHFMINPHLDDPAELATFERFTDELVDLILDNDGSLKAEHGTGRVMAPFVRRQYGDELYEVMRELKRLCDPSNMLNPGVIIEDNPRAHVENIKIMPGVQPKVDACVECGYCEPTCPSKDVAVTPRQRIALMRTMEVATPALKAELEKAFNYEAIDLCAADSLCVTSCPVKIDTGKVMKSLRAERAPRIAQIAGNIAAKNWDKAGVAVRAGLGVGQHINPAVVATTKALRKVLPTELVPAAGKDLPGPGSKRPTGHVGGANVRGVFFPSCISAMFAPERGEDGLLKGVDEALISLCTSAGVGLNIPQDINSLCCTTVWQSKGLVDGLRTMSEMVFDSVWKASKGGLLPIISDAASCTHGLFDVGDKLTGVRAEQFKTLRFVDAITFAREEILPNVNVTEKLESVALHPTCSMVHMGIVGDLQSVAAAVADDVVVPDDWGCCAFAGDRGMLHPELTASATKAESREIREREEARKAQGLGSDGRFTAYASGNRTCEMGMSRATERPYVHILQVLESRVTSTKD
ncbi:FAD-binding and (Fe-S)-binding domain-containing protein [Timonella senegalensis]|uniref:FAD-binding and (Fe-S)-binding domain-containing protein n=1 Tax=Timonella senegalensis TaxID=1465825 RepID=UPI0028A7BEA4|nr:FAD-binding and (Fe-S)-binding domain-containing protein [Timonella senegalensis]